MNIGSIKARIKGNKIIYKLYSITIRNIMERRRVECARRELQLNGKAIIEKIENAFNKKKIEVFVNFGSLLGIVRDGRFMSFDHDIDFGVIDRDDFDWKKLEQILEECGGTKIKQFKLDGQITEQSYRFGHLDVDFFRCYIPDDEQMIQFLYYKEDGTSYKDALEYSVGEFHTVLIKGIKTIQIGDVKFSVPENSEEYLESIYTKNWRIQDPQWNHLKGPSLKLIDEKRGYLELFI